MIPTPKLTLIAALTVLSLNTATSLADWSTDFSPIQSALLGNNNWSGDTVYYRGHIANTGDPTWLNQVQFQPLTGDWTGITVTPSTVFTPRLGTQWQTNDQVDEGFLSGIFQVSYDSNVATPEIKTGRLNFLGGPDELSTDELFTHDFTFELMSAFNITHQISPTSYTTSPGGFSDITASVTAGDRDLWAWMYSTSGATPQLLNSHADFISWPAVDPSLTNGILPAGQTWTGTMFRWYAENNGLLTPPGPDTFEGKLGIMGGPYVNDQIMFEPQSYFWNVIPEPASLALLTLGSVFLTQRRRPQ